MPEITSRTIGEIKEVALKPEEITVADAEVAYWVIREPGKNLTIFPNYRLGGGEYPKTYGHFHEPEAEETYQIVLGKAGLLLQWGKGDTVSKTQLKVLNAGEKFTVPKGPGHTLINLGDGYLITLDDHDPSQMTNIYEDVKRMHGFGYRIVEVDGKWEGVPNPAFKNLPPLQIDE